MNADVLKLINTLEKSQWNFKPNFNFIKDFKIMTDGSYKYKNVKLVDVPHPTIDTMVRIDKGPARLNEVIGKRYVTLEKAMIAIDILSAEKLISTGARQAKEELMDMGLVDFEFKNSIV